LRHANLEEAVSNPTRFRRAFVALVAVQLAASLACASGPKETQAAQPRSAADTAAINTEGKTMEELFAGRFPGVTVARANNGGLQIRIRGGSNSFYGGDEPLIVVDDVPLPAGSGGVVYLAPADIQKIEVLKNPADIGLYGIRGGNGVVKITTKKARH
jgi:TonB-dependent SusC/RagA subfamily outer membrane receptor